MIPSRRASLALIAVVALAATSCSSGDPGPNEPTPPGTPPEATGSDNTPELETTTALDLYVALQHAIIQLAPTDPNQIDPDAAGVGIVADGSPAAAFLTDRLTTMIETGSGPSGQVIDGEVIDLHDAGERTSAELCVLQETELVDLATGQPAVGVPEPAEPRYLRIGTTYTHIGGVWLIDDIETEAPPEDCVPPSVELAVSDNWEDHEVAVGAWIDASFAVEARAGLQPLVTAERWQQIEDTPPAVPTGRVRGDISYDLNLLQATRTEVVGEWCIDGSRDPAATTLRNGELVQNDTRSIIRGRWHFEQGQWLRAAHDEARGDIQIFAGTLGAPEGHRCL